MRYRNEVGGQSKTPNKPPDTAPVFRVLLQRYWLTMRGGGGELSRLTAHATLSNKSAMTTAWPRIS